MLFVLLSLQCLLVILVTSNYNTCGHCMCVINYSHTSTLRYEHAKVTEVTPVATIESGYLVYAPDSSTIITAGPTAWPGVHN